MSKLHFFSWQKRGLVALLMGVCSAGCFAQQDTCSLKVNVTGMNESQGTLYAVLYDKASFMKNKLQVKNVKVENGAEPQSLTFDGLQKGSYAVVLLLDENGNGKTDCNEMGIPEEMIGFSNNASCSYGPPTFQDTEVVLDEDKTIQVKMYYLQF